MRILKKCLNGIDKVSDRIGVWTSLLTLFLIALITYVVIARYLLNSPSSAYAAEICTMIFGAMWLLGGSYNQLHDTHIRMDVLYVKLSPRKKAVADLITAPLFYIYVVILLVEGWDFAHYSLQIRELSTSAWAPPVYPIKLFIPIGAFLILLQGVNKTIRSLYLAVTGEELG